MPSDMQKNQRVSFFIIVSPLFSIVFEVVFVGENPPHGGLGMRVFSRLLIYIFSVILGKPIRIRKIRAYLLLELHIVQKYP